MIPMVARLHIATRSGREHRLWFPLFLLWLLALPFLIVSLPVIAIVLKMLGRRPFALFAAYWNLLRAVPGASIELNGRSTSVFVHIT
jgi:hypothetical protein